MASSLADSDLYALLGLAAVASEPWSLTEAEIKKAYRRRALECHPDKRPGDKAAAAEFNLLQQAYEVLSDPEARKAYDGVRRLRREREQRLSQQSGKRAKMVADLEQREREGEREREQQQRQEEQAKQRLKQELERLRKLAAEKRAQAAAAAADDRVETASAGRDGTGTAAQQNEELQRTLRVSWTVDPGGVPAEEYSAAKMREIFAAFGAVEDVVVREKKGKKKKKSDCEGVAGTIRGSALVVMATEAAARAAAASMSSSASSASSASPLLQVSLAAPPQPQGGSASSQWDSPFADLKSRPECVAPKPSASPLRNATPPPSEDGEGPVGCATGEPRGAAGQSRQGQSSGGAGPRPAVVGSSYRDYESATLKKMMEAAARARERNQKQAENGTGNAVS